MFLESKENPVFAPEGMFNPQDGYGQLYGGAYGAVEFENPLYHLNSAVAANDDGYDHAIQNYAGYATTNSGTSESAYVPLSDPTNSRLQSNEGYIDVSGGYASLNHSSMSNYNNSSGAYDTMKTGNSLTDAGYSIVNNYGSMEPAYDFLHGTQSADESGGYGFGDDDDYMKTYAATGYTTASSREAGISQSQPIPTDRVLPQDDYIAVNDSLSGFTNTMYHAEPNDEAHPYEQEEYMVVNDANDSPQGFINPNYDPRAIDEAGAYLQEEYVVVNNANDTPQGFTNPGFDPRAIDETNAYTHDEYMEVNEVGNTDYDTETYGFGPEPVYLESDVNPISILSQSMKSWGLNGK